MMTSCHRTTSKRSLSLRSWFWHPSLRTMNHSISESRPTCSLCGRYRSSRFCEKNLASHESISAICSRPTCAKFVQEAAATGPSYVVEVHHYHHDHCDFSQEVPLTPENPAIVEAPGDDVVVTVTELPTAPTYRRRRKSSIPLPTIFEEGYPPQPNRTTKPVFHPK